VPNARITELIAAKLRSGLTHPGDPERNIPSRPIVTPFGRTAGMPKEMADLMNASTKMWAEAIVHTIETEGGCELVPREDAVEMRRAVGAGPPAALTLPVHCRCDRDLRDPLVFIAPPRNDRIVIDGPALLEGLRTRGVECPHPREGK
jgi:hypothetical protein